MVGTTQETKKEAYTKYKAFLDSLPKKIQYAMKDIDEDYIGYYWDILKKHVKQICDDKLIDWY